MRGFPSLFEYAVKELGYFESAAREVDQELVGRCLHPESFVKEKVKAAGAKLSQVTILVDVEFLGLVEEVRNVLGRSRADVSMKDVLEYSLKQSVEKLRPKQPKTRPSKPQPKTPSLPASAVETARPAEICAKEKKISPSYTPKDTEYGVWTRDNARCTYRDPVTVSKVKEYATRRS